MNGEPLLPGFAPDDVTVEQLDAMHIRVSAAYTYISILGVPIPNFGLGQGDTATNFTFNAQSSMRAL
ncbi:MAG: hypothetical protein P8X88_05115 [Gammaproteobacteria bacterium]